MSAKKFTFKTIKPTGRYSSFHSNKNLIKLNGFEVGLIEDKLPYSIRLAVEKENINEDGNPNCSWKWIKLKKESGSLQEAKDFLQSNYILIISTYKLYSIQ